MIYTLTMNPSLDYFVTVEEFRLGKTNRTETEQLLPGGKGINVSTVLRNLGRETTALGFTAGFVGEELERRVAALGIRTEFFRLAEGNSRINIKLKNSNGTEINGRGPKIAPAELEKLWNRLESLKTGDTLVLAGSVPEAVPQDFYRKIMERFAGKQLRIVVDASGELLRSVLRFHPFLVKPNEQELGELFGVTLHTREEAVSYAIRLRELGAVNVLVSLGGAGAILVSEEGAVYQSDAPSGTLVNAVGAGDSMVAGFLAGYEQTGQYGTALRMGIAAGSASAFSEQLATKEEVDRLLRAMEQ